MPGKKHGIPTMAILYAAHGEVSLGACGTGVNKCYSLISWLYIFLINNLRMPRLSKSRYFLKRDTFGLFAIALIVTHAASLKSCAVKQVKHFRVVVVGVYA